MKPISKVMQAAALVALFAAAAFGQATTRTITDTIRKPDGSAWVGATVKFTLDKSTYTSTTSFPAATVTATTDAQGRICVSPCSSPGVALWTNAEGAVKTLYTATYPDGSTFQFRLSIGDGSAVAVPVLRAGGIQPAAPADPLYVSTQGLVTTHAAVDGSSLQKGHLQCGEGVTCTNGVISVSTASALDDLTDVTLTSPANAHALVFNGSLWENRALVKGDVGLGNVDNTSDANKPVSTAQQAALDAKAAASDLTAEASTRAAADSTLTTAVAGRQPLDSDLTTIAGLSPGANDVMQFVSGAWSARTTAQLKTSLGLTQSDVAGLTTASSPTFAGLTVSGLGSNKLVKGSTFADSLLSDDGTNVTLASGAVVLPQSQTSLRFGSSSYAFGYHDANSLRIQVNSSTTASVFIRGVAMTEGLWALRGIGLGSTSVSSPDTFFYSDAANTLALRNSTSAQTLRWYFSFTDTSNYQRGALSTSSTAVTLSAESAGTGAANIDITLTPKGTGSVVPPSDDGVDLGASAKRWRTINVATSIVNGGGYNWSSGSRASSPADGNILLRSSTSSFGLLQFGGTNSGFGAIKNEGSAALSARLADDSAYTKFRASVLETYSGSNAKHNIASAEHGLASDVPLKWYSGAGIFSSSADAGLARAFAGGVKPTNGSTGEGIIATGTSSNTDMAGTLTLTAGTVTYTFSRTYTSAPICVANDATAAAAVKVVSSTTNVVFTGTGTDTIVYQCIARN